MKSLTIQILALIESEIKTSIDVLIKSGEEFDLRKDIYFRIIYRIYKNFQGARILYDIDKDNLAPSIALLLRACIMDSASFYYFETFSSDPKTFTSEVKASDIEYINACFEICTMESKWHGDIVKDLRLDNCSELFKTEPFIKENLKSQKEIRINFMAEKSLYYNPNETFTSTKKVTDSAKFAQIKEKGKNLCDIEALQYRYKFFSQFQHFSSEGSKLFTIDRIENYCIEAFIDCSKAMVYILTLWPEFSSNCEKIKGLISGLNELLQKE